MRAFTGISRHSQTREPMKTFPCLGCCVTYIYDRIRHMHRVRSILLRFAVESLETLIAISLIIAIA